jgi:fusaric acid resistance family protein
MNTTIASADARDKRPTRREKLTNWLSKVFAFNASGVNWPRGVMFVDIALVPIVVFAAIGHEQYLLTAVFGAFLLILIDPGGAIGQRVLRIAIFAIVGAGLTALAFSLGGSAWGWLVLASFLVTLIAGFGIIRGLHTVVSAILLNVWFIIALGLAVSLHQHPQISNHIWAQVVAWTSGAALWLVFALIMWLIRGRNDMPQPVAEIPGDTSPRKLTGPMIAFSVLRAVAIAGSVALAFGLSLSHAQWLPIATIIAVKPSLQQSTISAAQRVIGALLGAGIAILLLLIPADQNGLRLLTIVHALDVVAIILLMHAVAIRLWNYAIYTSAIAAAVLILEDLAQPSDYSAEGDRVLWTLAGTGIGVFVMLIAGLLAKRSASS